MLLKKRVSRSQGGDLAMIIFILVFTAIMMIPLVYAVSNSLKPYDELWVFPPKILVSNPTLKNYTDLFSLMTDTWIPMSRYIFNTVFITVVGTVAHVILSSMAAYQFAKYNFPGSKGMFKLVKTALMFSSSVLAIPNYLIMNTLGLIDTYWALILPAVGGTLGLFLMKQFMTQMIPMSLLESADIDGASEWTKFMKLVMPMVKPGWLTLTVFCVKDLWQTGASPYIYNEALKTFSYALSQIAAGGIARQGVGMAISMVMLAVPLLVFIITQSNIIETMATSGMKD